MGPPRNYWYRLSSRSRVTMPHEHFRIWSELQTMAPCLLTMKLVQIWEDWNISAARDDGIIWRTALSSEHIIRRAPSDKMAVISTLVLIFVSSSGQERKYAHSEIFRKIMERELLTYFHYCFCDCHSWALTSKTRKWCDTGFKFY